MHAVKNSDRTIKPELTAQTMRIGVEQLGNRDTATKAEIPIINGNVTINRKGQ